jgi:hypothetical protein
LGGGDRRWLVFTGKKGGAEVGYGRQDKHVRADMRTPNRVGTVSPAVTENVGDHAEINSCPDSDCSIPLSRIDSIIA